MKKINEIIILIIGLLFTLFLYGCNEVIGEDNSKLFPKDHLIFLAKSGPEPKEDADTSINEKESQEQEKNIGIEIMDFQGKSVGFIPWTLRPFWLKTSPDNRLYVMDEGNILTVLDINNQCKEISKFALPKGSSLDMELDTKGENLYIAGVLDGETGLATISRELSLKSFIKIPQKKGRTSDLPYGLVIDDENKKAYVAVGGPKGGTVVEIELAGSKTVREISSLQFPYGLAISEDKTSLYVSSFEKNEVSLFDLSTQKVMSSIPVELNPSKIKLSPKGDKIYVLNSGTDTVSVINCEDRAMKKKITVGKKPVDLDFSQEGDKAFISNNVSENITIVDTQTDSVIFTTEKLSGGNPFGIAVTKEVRSEK